MKIKIPRHKDANTFHELVEGWIEGMMSLDVRYISMKSGEKWYLTKCNVTLGPTRFKTPLAKEIETSDLRVGLLQENFSKREIFQILEQLYLGKLNTKKISYAFPEIETLDYYAPLSEESNYLQYQISLLSQFKQRLMFSHIENRKVNAELRCLPTPFDGIADLFSFVGFQGQNQMPTNAEILIRIEPPVALLLDECRLENNKLVLKLVKQTKFPSTKINLGLRLFPNPTFDRRLQIAENIKWNKDKSEQHGILEISLEATATSEIMLSASGHSISRYFVVDKNKSLNLRLTNYTKYDPNLTYLKEKIFCSPKESRQLEFGIASLAYLLGFTTFKPPLDDAPDLIIETKQGRSAIIECTTKVTDIRVKAGKLVNRRYMLQNNPENGSFMNDVLAILVINLPKAQIVDETNYLIQNEVLLVTREDLDASLDRLELPADTDGMFNDAKDKLRNALSHLKGSSGN